MNVSIRARIFTGFTRKKDQRIRKGTLPVINSINNVWKEERNSVKDCDLHKSNLCSKVNQRRNVFNILT